MACPCGLVLKWADPYFVIFGDFLLAKQKKVTGRQGHSRPAVLILRPYGADDQEPVRATLECGPGG